jgi:hypothetical protein
MKTTQYAPTEEMTEEMTEELRKEEELRKKILTELREKLKNNRLYPPNMCEYQDLTKILDELITKGKYPHPRHPSLVLLSDPELLLFGINLSDFHSKHPVQTRNNPIIYDELLGSAMRITVTVNDVASTATLLSLRSENPEERSSYTNAMICDTLSEKVKNREMASVLNPEVEKIRRIREANIFSQTEATVPGGSEWFPGRLEATPTNTRAAPEEKKQSSKYKKPTREEAVITPPVSQNKKEQVTQADSKEKINQTPQDQEPRPEEQKVIVPQMSQSKEEQNRTVAQPDLKSDTGTSAFSLYSAPLLPPPSAEDKLAPSTTSTPPNQETKGHSKKKETSSTSSAQIPSPSPAQITSISPTTSPAPREEKTKGFKLSSDAKPFQPQNTR